MPNELVLVDRAGKKFHRTLASGFFHGLADGARRMLRMKQRERLGKDEFWALRDVSFTVRRGECLGVIGPNGAGKTTLLKLINRDCRPDEGSLTAFGALKSLIRIGSGLQPLLSGRENIYIQCQQMGLDKPQTDALLDGIVAFAGLADAIDRPVKTYSDGMYARLEFSIATSVQADVLLVDEVLAVGDIAFQIRALDRLNQLKRNGAAVVFVSHSEMNVMHVADRCLLLFDGRQVALGTPEALFCKYYESIGYLNKRLKTLGALMQAPEDLHGELTVAGLRPVGTEIDELCLRTGTSLDLALEYEARNEIGPVRLIVHFWNAAGVLVASIDSGLMNRIFLLQPGKGVIRLRIPFVSLTPDIYKVSAGFRTDGQWRAYRGRLLELTVTDHNLTVFQGFSVIRATFEE